MKVWIVWGQASYDDDTSLHHIFKFEDKANEASRKLQFTERSQYVKYWVEEWELEE